MKSKTKSAVAGGRRRAFTLVEVLVTLTLFMMLMAGVMGSYLYSLNTFSYDLGRTLVNRDYRTFMTSMTNSVTFCNHIRVLSEFNDRTVYTDSNGNISGNFVLCVYEQIQSSGENNITRIIGFYRGSGSGGSPIRTFDVTTNVPADTDLMTLIPATGTINSSAHRQVFPDSAGLNPGGKMFRDYKNDSRGLMVFGEMINPGNLAKKASNTIHFTVVRRS